MHSEGINQKYLKNWADVADKYASAVPKNLGLGQRYTYRVLQTIEMKLILCVSGQSRTFWAELKLL